MASLKRSSNLRGGGSPVLAELIVVLFLRIRIGLECYLAYFLIVRLIYYNIQKKSRYKPKQVNILKVS